MKGKHFISAMLLWVSGLLFGQVDRNIQAIVQRGHSKPVSCSAFSADGRFLASGSVDNSIILWDLKYGKQVKSLGYHFDRIRSVVFNRETTTVLSTSRDNTVKLVNIITGELIHDLKLPEGEVYSAGFSANEKYIIGTDKRDGIWVWSTATGKLLGQYKKDYSTHFTEGLINPEETRVLSKQNYKSVVCLDLGTGDTVLRLPFDKAYRFQFSPDGRFIVISSNKLFATVFDAEKGTVLHELKSNSEKPCDGCKTNFGISPNSQYIFTMSNKNDGILWDSRSGKKLKLFGKTAKRPQTIAFSHDSRYLCLSFDKTMEVYDIKTGRQKMIVENIQLDYYRFLTSPLNNMVAVPGDNYTVELLDFDKGSKGKTLKGYLNEKKADGLKFDYSNWIDQAILKYISYKNNVSVHPKDNHLLIGKVDSVAIVLDMMTGRKQRVIKDNHKAVFCHDYSPDGAWMATAGGDGVIRVYDTENYTLKYELKGHRALIFDLRFSGNGNEIVSGSWDGTIKAWDFKSGKIRQNILLDNVSPYLVRYSPKDLYIVSGDLNKNVQFWEFDSRQNFRSLIGHTNTVSGIEFSPDNKSMVTSSWDGKIKVWDVLTGMLLAKIESTNAPVYCVAYHSSKPEVVSGGGDQKLRVWSTETGDLIAVLKGHTASVTDATVTANGKFIISRAANGEVKLWDYNTKKELYTYLQINGEDWLVKSPSGHFDGSKEALKLVNYVSGLEVITVESLFDRFYTPKLIERLMSGEKINDSGETLQELIDGRPELTFDIPELTSRSGGDKNNSSFVSKTKELSLDIAVESHGNAIEEIRLYNNGKLIKQENFGQVVFRSLGAGKHSFDLELVNGKNQIKAIALTENKVESAPVFLNISFDGEAAKTDLFILSIGINAYKNSNYNLNYAVKDATDFSKSLESGGAQLFNQVYQYNLLNAKATKVEIETVFKSLEEKIGPEDVFVFYYAGHGVMSLKTDTKPEDFYIVTHDVVSFYGDDITLKGVSAKQLLNYSKHIAAQKQLFILDACHSGGALDAIANNTRGVGREKALAQLARNTGTFFLTASQDAQYANEAGDLKHGLFTYALIEVLEGQYEGAAIDGKITINEMKTYVEERVPELSERYHGSAQYPTSYSFGQDFPIVILK